MSDLVDNFKIIVFGSNEILGQMYNWRGPDINDDR